MRYAVRIGLAVLSILLPSIALAQPEWKLPHGPNTASGHTGTGVVSIDGDFVVVGDPEDDQICPADSADCDAGAAHLYQLIDGDWRHVKRLEDPAPSSGNKFGQTVAVGGDYVLVSSYRDYATPESPLAGAGFVYYRHQGGTDNWGLQKKLKPDDIDPEDRVEFGKTLDIGPTHAALSYYHERGIGRRVFLYERDRGGDGNWGLQHFFGASTFDRQSKPGTTYGGAVALGGEYLFVGDGETSGNGNAPGSIYFYRIEAGRHSASRKLMLLK